MRYLILLQLINSQHIDLCLNAQNRNRTIIN